MRNKIMMSLFFMMIASVFVANAFFYSPLRPSSSVVNQKRYRSPLIAMNIAPFEAAADRIAPCMEDMQAYSAILANITDNMVSSPEIALSIASQNMGWLFARDVPKLTQMLLDTFPVLRQNKGMMEGYMFLLDFLEVVSKQTSALIKTNQKLMLSLLEASKVSESNLDDFVQANAAQLTSPEFFIYLDSEIDNQDSNSALENLLVTVKLRLLEEQGKSMGVDILALPKLAAEGDPEEMRRKTIEHISGYDRGSKELFLQTLRIMLSEMGKRYTNVDPGLIMSLGQIEKIVKGELGQR